MADFWALTVSTERYAAERLVANDNIELPAYAKGALGVGDRVLLVADGSPPLLFGLGQVRLAGAPKPVIRYTHRLLDEPLPLLDAGPLATAGCGLHGLPREMFESQAGRVGTGHRTDADKRTWLVSVDLPIEARSAAEAVRLFWSYVYELGPQELVTLVTPSHDELAMQAFVLGAEANLDPEEED
jgi:hypothetical protein